MFYYFQSHLYFPVQKYLSYTCKLCRITASAIIIFGPSRKYTIYLKQAHRRQYFIKTITDCSLQTKLHVINLIDSVFLSSIPSLQISFDYGYVFSNTFCCSKLSIRKRLNSTSQQYFYCGFSFLANNVLSKSLI